MIGHRLYQLRKEAGLSQKELGARLSVSHHTVSSYEKGKSDPSDEIKIRIARLFDVSVDYLVGLIDEPLPSRRDDGVLILPENLTPPERRLLTDFVSFLGLKRKR